MGSKKLTFSHLVKAQLHQIAYLNFIIPFFNIFLLFYFYLFIFFTTPKIPTFPIFFLTLPLYPLYIPSLYSFSFFLHFFPTTHVHLLLIFIFIFLFFFFPTTHVPTPFLFSFSLRPPPLDPSFSFFFSFSFFLFPFQFVPLPQIPHFLSFFLFSLSPSLNSSPFSVRPPLSLCFCFRSVWGYCCYCFRYSWRRRQKAREKKYDCLIVKRMNSCSSNLWIDCSSSSVFHSFREAGVVRFSEIFAIFGCFIRFIKPTVNALSVTN